MSNLVRVESLIYYNGQFWIGVWERYEKGSYSVARHIFGPSEPSDEEVYLLDTTTLIFRQAILPDPMAKKLTAVRNFKLEQRKLRKAIRKEPDRLTSKAQEALAATYELFKKEKKVKGREEQLKERQRKFELKRTKKKEKHRGH